MLRPSSTPKLSPNPSQKVSPPQRQQQQQPPQPPQPPTHANAHLELIPRRPRSEVSISDARSRKTGPQTTPLSRLTVVTQPNTKKASSVLGTTSQRVDAPRPGPSPRPAQLQQPGPSFSVARHALRTRDRNAALSSRPATPRFSSPLKTPLKTLSKTTPPSPLTVRPMHTLKPSTTSTMGYDKETPRKPTLASRPFTRAPLTPKIASSASSTISSSARPHTPSSASAASSSPYQTVTVATPLSRRTTGLSASSTSTSNYRSRDSHRDDVASPVPSYLNNITPRSGSRQNRVDGSSTTPTGTPTHGHGPGHTTGYSLGSGAGTAPDPDSKFFYASDARSSTAPATVSASAVTPSLAAASASPSLAPLNRSSTFFYANGQQPPALASPTHTPSMTSPTTASPQADHLASKFVHANGAALERPQQPKLAAAGSSRAVTPQSASRPLSPVKMVSAVSPYPLQRSNSSRSNAPATLSLNAAALSASSTSPPLGPTSPGSSSSRMDMLSRQRSTFSASIGSIGSNSSNGGGHSRQGSLTIADPPTVARLLHNSSQPDSETSSPASMQFPSGYPFPSVSPGIGGSNANATSGLAAILQAADDLAEDEEQNEEGDGEDGTSKTDKPHDGEALTPGSPGQPATTTSAPIDDLVANARRERKVQDLEIRNASLEAINRSLERQLRKQKSELRQFRRLSRSGRLSLAPSGSAAEDARDRASGVGIGSGGSRITSSSTVEGPLQDPDRILRGALSDDGDDSFDDDNEYFSEMEVSFNNDDGDDGFDSSSSASSSGAVSRHRKRDERRLQLDLSKHRQLLVDSQKINQSIKRCMNWTEALLQEGRQALAFQVRVSEVQLGGRVLAADEVEERAAKARDLLDMEHAGGDAGDDADADMDRDDHSTVSVTADTDVQPTESQPPSLTSLNTPRTESSAASEVALDENSHIHQEVEIVRDEPLSPASPSVRTVRFDMDPVKKAEAAEASVPSTLDAIASDSKLQLPGTPVDEPSTTSKEPAVPLSAAPLEAVPPAEAAPPPAEALST